LPSRKVIRGSESGGRMTDDRLRYVTRGTYCNPHMHKSKACVRYSFNELIEKYLPGLNVASLRHVIEAISLQAAGVNFNFQEANTKDDERMAMIALSAHSASTSDGHYAGDQFQLAGVPGFHVDKQVSPRSTVRTRALCMSQVSQSGDKV
jgi:hypothetical protein